MKITAQEKENHNRNGWYVYADVSSPKDGRIETTLTSPGTPYYNGSTRNGVTSKDDKGVTPATINGKENIPKLTTSINGVVVKANNDGKDDHGSFAVNNKLNNIVCNSFSDQNGLKDPLLKVYQTYTADNVTVPYCNQCAASMAAFKGATATAALINPALPGQLILRFRSWIDKNKNGMIDQTEPASDWIVYTITCRAGSSTTVIPKLTTSINGVVVKANNDGTEDHGSFAVNNKTNNIVCNSFTDQNGITDPLLKVYQTYTADNITVPYCNQCAATMAAFKGATATAALINPSSAGQLILRFRSWIDKNKNGLIDQIEPASDWIVYTITCNAAVAVVPKLATSINGVVVKSNNDGTDDHGSFSVNNKANNIVCNSFTDQNGIIDPLLKVYQTFTADNISVPYCNNCAASMAAFAGTTATAALINPSSAGQLILRFRSWIDKNNNGVIDQTEPASDWIVYSITCNASVSMAIIPRLTTSINGVVVKSNNDGTDDQASFTVNNKTNNIVCNSFTDQNGITDPLLKVFQTYTAVNVTVPYCNNCSAPMPAFTGATATAALINPAAGGQLILRFRSWIDKNSNGVIEQTEPASDWIVYTIKL